MDFSVVFICAVVGLCVRGLIGFNPWVAFGTASLAILIVPGLLMITVQSDPAVAQTMADGYVARLVIALPSMLIGELAGFFAKELFRFLQSMVNSLTRSL